MFERIAVVNRFALDYLRQILADLDDADLAAVQFAGQNPPAWNLGHLAVVADYGLSLVGGSARSPRAWRAQFGPGSKPSDRREDYPSKAELQLAVESGYDALVQAVQNVDADTLAKPHTFPPLLQLLPTRGDMLTHLLTTHFAGHLAQISQWRRQKGLPALF